MKHLVLYLFIPGAVLMLAAFVVMAVEQYKLDQRAKVIREELRRVAPSIAARLDEIEGK